MKAYAPVNPSGSLFAQWKSLVQEIDLPLIGALFLLGLLGVSLSFISTFNISLKLTGNAYYFSSKQAMVFGFSFVLMVFLSLMPLEKVTKRVGWIFFITVAMLLMVFFEPFGREISGTRRWLTLWQYRFQPSELAKLAAIVILSHQLAKKTERGIFTFSGFVLPPFAVLSILCGLIVIQPDLSSGFVIFASGLLLFASSPMPFIHILTALVALLPLSLTLLESKRYYLDRLLFISPDSEPFGRGYHLLQSLGAIKGGGFSGEAITQSLSRLSRLPDAHNDFIFTTLSNMAGFVGVFFAVCLYAFIFLRTMHIASLQKEPLYRFQCLGVAYIWALQSILHMLVTTGLVPTTGITLPLLSYGGSSLLVTLLMFSMVLRHSRKSHTQVKITP